MPSRPRVVAGRMTWGPRGELPAVCPYLQPGHRGGSGCRPGGPQPAQGVRGIARITRSEGREMGEKRRQKEKRKAAEHILSQEREW